MVTTELASRIETAARCKFIPSFVGTGCAYLLPKRFVPSTARDRPECYNYDRREQPNSSVATAVARELTTCYGLKPRACFVLPGTILLGSGNGTVSTDYLLYSVPASVNTIKLLVATCFGLFSSPDSDFANAQAFVPVVVRTATLKVAVPNTMFRQMLIPIAPEVCQSVQGPPLDAFFALL